MSKEFGFFGEGLDGYLHYKQAFDASFPGDKTEEVGADEKRPENGPEDEASEEDDEFLEEEFEEDFSDGEDE